MGGAPTLGSDLTLDGLQGAGFSEPGANDWIRGAASNPPCPRCQVNSRSLDAKLPPVVTKASWCRLPGTSTTPSAVRRPTKCHELHPALLVKKDWTVGSNSFDGAVIDFCQNTALRCNSEHELISVKKPALGPLPCPATPPRVDLNQVPLYNFCWASLYL